MCWPLQRKQIMGRAEKEGLEVLEASEAVKKSDFVIMLVPDEKQQSCMKNL